MRNLKERVLEREVKLRKKKEKLFYLKKKKGGERERER